MKTLDCWNSRCGELRASCETEGTGVIIARALLPLHVGMKTNIQSCAESALLFLVCPPVFLVDLTPV